jgi:hypothetical protein
LRFWDHFSDWDDPPSLKKTSGITMTQTSPQHFSTWLDTLSKSSLCTF